MKQALSEVEVTEDVQDSQAEQQPVEVKPSAGQTLAEARERLGLSIPDVARQLRLSARQVEALEADDYSNLPAQTFLRGFIRNYAKLLQLDPEPLLAGCQGMEPKDRAIVVPTSQIEFGGKRRFMPFSDRSRRPMPKNTAVIVVVAGLLLSWGVYELIQWQSQPFRSEPAKAAGETTLSLPLPQPQVESAEQTAAEPPTPKPEGETVPLPLPAPTEKSAEPTLVPPQAAAPVPVPAKVAASAPVQAEPAAAAGGKLLSFVFEGDSWVEVRDKSGKVVFSQLNQKGSQQSVRITPPFSLVVGNAAHVKLFYNDKPVDLAPHIKVDVARLTLE
ncbi:MAG: RodZ domain-containing protein [Betaproteobacteria bacterium]